MCQPVWGGYEERCAANESSGGQGKRNSSRALSTSTGQQARPASARRRQRPAAGDCRQPATAGSRRLPAAGDWQAIQSSNGTSGTSGTTPGTSGTAPTTYARLNGARLEARLPQTLIVPIAPALRRAPNVLLQRRAQRAHMLHNARRTPASCRPATAPGPPRPPLRTSGPGHVEQCRMRRACHTHILMELVTPSLRFAPKAADARKL